MSKSNKKALSPNKLPGSIWFNICLFGFVGQVAWNLENMYYNTFMYNTVYNVSNPQDLIGAIPSMTAIKYMVALSAVTAVVTTFIMGNLSDKVNRRKVFISVGYILWGVITAAFGFITKENIGSLLGITEPSKIISATAVTIIAMDCLMTFVGSTSNDSAFNAWITDITTSKNRATAESVLSILPVVATLVVVLFGGLIDTMGGYSNFFFIIGGFVILSGVVGLFTLKDSRSGERNPNKNYWKDLAYGFKPSVIKEHSKLYIALGAVCIYSIAVQIFFPYLLIYLDHGLGLKIENLVQYLTPPVIVAIPFILAAAVGGIIGIGKLIDKVGKKNFVFVAAVMFIVGLIACSFMKKLSHFVLAALPMLCGYILLGIMLNSTVRDYTPEDKVGLFQGIRMIFFVLIPMVIGPSLGDAVCKAVASGTYINETGIVTYEPCGEMFLAAGVFAILVLIPLIILRKKGIDKTE